MNACMLLRLQLPRTLMIVWFTLCTKGGFFTCERQYLGFGQG